MEIALIYAQDRNGAIGRGNTLPWRLPEDLRHFKEVTLGAPVIMGRRTWESLPIHPLPGRQNIVLSGRPLPEGTPAVGASTLADALALAASARPALVFVIGGEQVYHQALKVADRVEVTDIDLEVEGADAFAPNLDERWAMTQESAWHTSSTGLRYRYRRYERQRERR